jgi:DNA-directed RNA polymerase subunit RPC12/RpoP
MYYGIEPTHIVALDPFSTYEEIEGIDWSKTRTKLVAHPGVWPSLIEKWPNEILLYLENLGKPDSFYADIEKKMYSWREEQGLGQRKPKFNFYIRTEIILFAASPPLQLFVADLLGYGPFFTAGVDFGYSHNKSRFTGYTINENFWSYDKIASEGEKIKNELSNNKETDTKLFWDRFNNTFQNSAIKEIEWIKHESPLVKNDNMIMSNNGILTEDIHLYYKKNYLSAWRLLGKTMYSTDQGIVPEIPYIDIHKVVRNQGYGFPIQTPEMIADIVETYLAGVGAFIVDSGQGIGFIECANPEVDLMAYMSEILNLYKCGNCNATVKSSTTKSDLEKELVECPQCKEKKLVHINKTLNVEANVKRIHKRLIDSGIEVKSENWVLT